MVCYQYLPEPPVTCFVSNHDVCQVDTRSCVVHNLSLPMSLCISYVTDVVPMFSHVYEIILRWSDRIKMT
jgi:hypothetical protein